MGRASQVSGRLNVARGPLLLSHAVCRALFPTEAPHEFFDRPLACHSAFVEEYRAGGKRHREVQVVSDQNLRLRQRLKQVRETALSRRIEEGGGIVENQ